MKIFIQYSLNILIVSGILLFFFLSCQNAQNQVISTSEFSVLTWNIWHGGLHGAAVDGYPEDSLNTQNVLKVLKHVNADVILMQETYCCGMEIAKTAGYNYSWRGSSNLSIHSKYPIIDTIPIFKPFNSHATIIDINHQKILFINLWLHYLPDYFKDIKTKTPSELIIGEETSRLSEIKAILAAVDSLASIYQNTPIIIGGDFNSGSHLDWTKQTKSAHYDKIVEWPVSKTMQLNGFTDSYRKIHSIPITEQEGTWGFLSDDIITDRIDFIYFKGRNIKTIDSKIIGEDPQGGFFNSDHKAIFSTFSTLAN